MTNKTAIALQILSNVTTEEVSPRQFAKLYFPKSHEGWQRVGKAGHGSTRGQGLVLFAGGFMGKLRRKGFIDNNGKVTELGLKFMSEFIGVQNV